MTTYRFLIPTQTPNRDIEIPSITVKSDANHHSSVTSYFITTPLTCDEALRPTLNICKRLQQFYASIEGVLSNTQRADIYCGAYRSPTDTALGPTILNGMICGLGQRRGDVRAPKRFPPWIYNREEIPLNWNIEPASFILHQRNFDKRYPRTTTTNECALTRYVTSYHRRAWRYEPLRLTHWRFPIHRRTPPCSSSTYFAHPSFLLWRDQSNPVDMQQKSNFDQCSSHNNFHVLEQAAKKYLQTGDIMPHTL